MTSLVAVVQLSAALTVLILMAIALASLHRYRIQVAAQLGTTQEVVARRRSGSDEIDLFESATLESLIGNPSDLEKATKNNSRSLVSHFRSM